MTDTRAAQIEAVRHQIHNEVKAEVMSNNSNRQQRVAAPPPRPYLPTCHMVYGTTNTQTTVYHCDASAEEVQAGLQEGRLKASRKTEIPPGTRMCLFYPQVRLSGCESIFMRTHLVDSLTAEITEGWALVYHTVDGKPVRCVKNFSV